MRGSPGRRWRWSSRRIGCLVVAQLQVDGHDLEGHLVRGAENRLVGRVQGDDLVGPRIVAQEALERHGGLLLEVVHVELVALGDQGLHPEGVVDVALDEAIAEHGLIERLEGGDAGAKLFQIEAEVLLPVDEFLGVEQLHGFFGCLGVVIRGVVHRDALKDGGRGEEHAVVEGVLGVQPVAEDDVRDLEGENGVEVAHLLRAILGDDAGGVDQALGEDDRVADGGGLKRLREQGADADGP